MWEFSTTAKRKQKTKCQKEKMIKRMARNAILNLLDKWKTIVKVIQF